ncbi:MAG: cytochrome c [Alphaproteobacteria bacterium]|nr:cytochrome c [Alphaproteobacteria bacterium]
MRAAAALLLCALAAGCTRSNMDDQPKYNEYKPALLFPDGRALQAPVPGTVARDDLARAAQAQKPALTAALIARGHAQYDVFCSPCHDRVGSGDGIVVQRGFPRPPSLQADRLRQADDQHLVDAITKGYGTMYAFADRVAPPDRWAIVAYIRALQLSQHAAPDDVPAEQRAALEKPP